MREKILKEHKKHGQISLYKHSGKVMLFPCHWHDEYELIYFYKNSAVLKIESQSFEMKEGTFALFNPGELHTVSSKKGTESGIYALVFKLNDVYDNFHNIFEENDLCKNIFDTYFKENHSHLQLKSQLYHLLFTLKTKTFQNSNENIKAVLSYIEDNFSEKLTVEILASEAKLSKYHFIRVFKAYTDTTPIKHLNEVRISKAKELIFTENIDVTNTALQVGFDNVSYFIKMFKKICGVTPLKYQRAIRMADLKTQGTVRNH